MKYLNNLSPKQKYYVLAGILVVVLVLTFVSAKSGWFQKLRTQVVTTPASDGSGFSISFENLHDAKMGDKITIPIGIGGITAEGKKIAGLYVSFKSLPAYLANPAVQLSKSTWSSPRLSEVQQGEFSFSTFGVQDPLASNDSSFATITFDVIDNPSDDAMEIEAILSDNSIPSASHIIPSTPINLTGIFTPPQLILVPSSPVHLAANATSVTLSLGLNGASEKTGWQVMGLEIDFTNLPPEFVSCQATTSLTNWTVGPTEVREGGLLDIVMHTAQSPITSNTENILDVVCTLSGQLSSSSLSFVGKAATEDQQMYNLDPKNFIIDQDPLEQYYKISGSISGDIVSGVTVSCGSYKGASDTSGNYTIQNLPDGTSCALKPNIAGYEFSPASVNVTISSSDITGQNFTSSRLLTCADKGKALAGDANIFELADVYELDIRMMNKTEGSDINGDGTFNHTDVVSLAQCAACLWDWTECGQ